MPAAIGFAAVAAEVGDELRAHRVVEAALRQVDGAVAGGVQMLAVELQIVVGGDAVGDGEAAGQRRKSVFFEGSEAKLGMLPSDKLVHGAAEIEPDRPTPSLTATFEVPLSDCTMAASVAPRPDTFQATSALPASQSTCAAVAQAAVRAEMPDSDTSAVNAGSPPRGVERDKAVAAAVVEAQVGQGHLRHLILDADRHLGAVDARAPVA